MTYKIIEQTINKTDLKDVMCIVEYIDSTKNRNILYINGTRDTEANLRTWLHVIKEVAASKCGLCRMITARSNRMIKQELNQRRITELQKALNKALIMMNTVNA